MDHSVGSVACQADRLTLVIYSGKELKFMRKLFSLFLVLLFLCPPAVSALAEALQIPEPTLSPHAEKYDETRPEDLSADQLYALSAILISAETGEVIFEKDPDTRRFPASTTKILTVLLAIQNVPDLDQIVTVSDYAVMLPDDSSTMKLQAGEEIPFIDVLYGTVLLSGNDGANVIAETVSGSVPAFVDLMNRTAAAYGCVDTHFTNPHGLHDENHYSTASDLAIIAREAMKNEIFRKIVSTTEYQISRTNRQRARMITAQNPYQRESDSENLKKYYYPYATGIKTGTTSNAGYCFVGSAEKDGVSLISVVMFTGNRARWADTIKLMNYGFSQYMSVTPMELYQMNPLTIVTSNYSTSDTGSGNLLLICKPPAGTAEPHIVATGTEIKRMARKLTDTMLVTYTRDLTAPITAGEEIATMTYYPPYSDPVVYSLVASRSVNERDNVPKTLEEIYNEAYADTSVLPPFSFELALVLFSPLLLILAVVIAIVVARKKHRSNRFRTPRPANRYVK